jgi:hypothetical protein
LAATGFPAVTDGLDGDLARLQQLPRRENAALRLHLFEYQSIPQDGWVMPGEAGYVYRLSM